MPINTEKYAGDRTTISELAIALGVIGIAIAGGFAIIGAARRLSKADAAQFGIDPTDEQATTIKAPLEAVEAAWVDWCATGATKLKNDYAIRFEPAPGARGTEVHLVGGGSAGTIREELRRFKQKIETGEVQMSDGPGLSRPAQPRNAAESTTLAEVRK